MIFNAERAEDAERKGLRENESMRSEELLNLARISACVALRKEERLRHELRLALKKTPVSLLRETILQTYLFAGYAAAINAFIVLNGLTSDSEFLTEKKASADDWKRRGTRLCRKIYAGQYDRLVVHMKQLHPDLADWMIREGYGKVLSRPFLSLRVRELLIVAMTAVLGVERQFHSHVKGALHVGATREEVNLVFREVVPLMKKKSVASLSKILDQITSE